MVNCGAGVDPTAIIDSSDTLAECEAADAGTPPPSDSSAPETTIASGPSAPTTAREASFAFTASEPARFECSLDSGAFAPCVAPAVYSSLPDGAHRFAVRAIDTAGNVDPTPAERGWSVFHLDPPPPLPTFDCTFAGSAPKKIKKALKRGVTAGFRCSEAANVTVRVELARASAYKLGLAKKRTGNPVTVASATLSGVEQSVRVTFTKGAKRAFRRRAKSAVRLTMISAAVGQTSGLSQTGSQAMKLRA